MVTIPAHWLLDLAILVNRLSLGMLFVFAGYGKIFDMGVGKFYAEGFLKLKPAWLPELVGRPYGYALPFMELIFGAMLVLGLLTRVTATILFLMLVSITIALIVAHGPSGGQGGYFHTNVILVTLAFLLAVVGPGRWAVDRFVCCRGRKG
jgi:uncharacterized membrane protein YphA (DoxX/SURF4 family)